VRVWAGSLPLVDSDLPAGGENSALEILIGFSGTEGSAGPLEIDFVDGDGRTGTVVGQLKRVEVARRCG